jgi:hypothetical protein
VAKPPRGPSVHPQGPKPINFFFFFFFSVPLGGSAIPNRPKGWPPWPKWGWLATPMVAKGATPLLVFLFLFFFYYYYFSLFFKDFILFFYTTVDTWRAIKIWTKNLTGILNGFLPLTQIPFMIKMKTRILNLKTLKTQVLMRYLTQERN